MWRTRIEKYNFKWLVNTLRDWLIIKLGGYTKGEHNKYRKTVYKHICDLKPIAGLTDDENVLIRNYRTDKLLHKGEAVIRCGRVKK